MSISSSFSGVSQKITRLILNGIFNVVLLFDTSLFDVT